jgi:hypothetical protein
MGQEQSNEQDRIVDLDVIVGETHAANRHSVIARGEFMSLLRNTPRCKELFDEMSRTAGAYEVINRTREAVGLFDAYLLAPSTDQRLVKAAKATAAREIMLFNAALQRIDSTPIVRLVMRYVTTELEMPWGWLVWEIMRSWTYTIIAWATRRTIRLDRYYSYTEPKPPSVDPPIVAQRPGETYQELIDRICRETEEILAKLKRHKADHSLPGGYNRPVEDVTRYTEWYFRHKVRGDAIRHIARHSMDGKPRGKVFEYPTKSVYIGIRDVEAWMGNTPYQIDIEEALKYFDAPEN